MAAAPGEVTMVATVAVELQLACEAPDVPREDAIGSLFGASLTASAVSLDNVEVAVRVVDEDEMRDLNSRYRNKDASTNVLSFPAELDALPGFETMGERFIGDIVLCAPVVAREAASQGKSASAHWQHLLVHGFLHLLGFDHVTDADAEQMEALEIAILRGWGLQNPYEVRHST